MTGITRAIICSVFISILTACGGGNGDKKVVNSAPTAVITSSVSEVAENTMMVFSAEMSNDPDGDTLFYSWAVENSNGDMLALTDNTGVTLEFEIQSFGDYTVTLQVQDGALTSAKARKQIRVTPSIDDYPSARVSGINVAKVGSTNWFSGVSSSGAHGQLISYHWQLAAKPLTSSAQMQNESSADAFFVADVQGDYEVLVTVKNVDDGLEASATIAIYVDEVTQNSPPIANVSYNERNYSVDETVTLAATDSRDLDGDQLFYTWLLLDKPDNSSVSLTNQTGEFLEFNADVEGSYVIRLMVSDEQDSSTMNVELLFDSDNTTPVANAGGDIQAVFGTTIELDASASFDSDGSDLQYLWALNSRPENSNYSDLTEQKLRSYHGFIFQPDVVGEYVLELKVYDGEAYSLPDYIKIEVSENLPPVAVLPESMIVQDSDQVTIIGHDSYDPEQQHLTYQWSFISIPENFEGELVSHSSIGIATFIPSEIGNYVIQLIVNDGIQDSEPATITVVRDSRVTYTRLVTGKLLDAGNNPIPNVTLGGVFSPNDATNEAGEFEVELSSSSINSSLRALTFNWNDQIRGLWRLPDYVDETDSLLELGDVTFPAMQRKDISVTACTEYSGPESITVSFHQNNVGYEGMTFYQPLTADFMVGNDPVQVMLPAPATLDMVVRPDYSISITTDEYASLFDHTYQANDNVVDPLTLVVCN